jgi:diaminopimelate decarboxylase
VVVKDEFLPADVTAGDLLAVPGTGAYCRSMASNYNHVPRPPVVAVRDGQARVIVRRETEDDLLALDVG